MKKLLSIMQILISMLILIQCSKDNNDLGTITGKITDDISGDLVQNAYVQIQDHPSYNVLSDSIGNYSIKIPVGEYDIIASKSALLPIAKIGFATVTVASNKESIKNIKIQSTKFEITTLDSSKFIMELSDVWPSILGTALLSLTKNPSDSLKNTIWDGIHIREYGEEIRQVKRITITGAPLIYQYPEYLNTFYFFPIQLISLDGLPCNWYWQGETLSGYRTSDNNIITQVSVPISSISQMVFIHENN